MGIIDQSEKNPMEAFSYEFFTQLAKTSEKDAMEYAAKFGGKTGEYDPEVAESKVKSITVLSPVQIKIDLHRYVGGIYTLDEMEITSIIEKRNFIKANKSEALKTNEAKNEKVTEEKPKEEEKDDNLLEIQKQYEEKIGVMPARYKNDIVRLQNKILENNK